MSESTVGAPARDRQQGLRHRLSDQELPEPRSIQAELQQIARSKAPEPSSSRGRRSKRRRKG